ncbi:type 2 lanthipeptide synthetase LanM family protein [Enterococcus sp. LJL99]
MSITNLAKGTSIRQRYELLTGYYLSKNIQDVNAQLENYTKWRQRPTTVTDERFDEYLNSLKLTKSAFDMAIKELTQEEEEYIFEQIQSEKWMEITQAILTSEDQSFENSLEQEKANFTYALRLHINYLEEQLIEIISEFPALTVHSHAVQEYLGECVNRFIDIGLRTFVYDLHVEKEKMVFSEVLDEKEGFHQYLAERFDTKEKLILFYTTYPVLTRLLAETIEFQTTNFRELLQAIAESERDLQQILQVSLPIHLTKIKMGAGDSHDRGKSVAILTFNDNQEIVYKPKNLLISERFDTFIREIKKIDKTLDFYLTTKIVKEKYSFEERLIYSECLTEEEVSHYYEQFGQIIGLVYLLNGNDFHLENVLACGKYPVLIDLETIIQNHFPMPDEDHAFAKALQENGSSVVMSGLVPSYVFEERVETDVEGAANGVQLSALSGGEQKLPYKVLKLTNYDSVNMQFTYQEHTTDAAENIPLFNGEKVDFVPYINTIIKGFKKFSAFAIQNREILAILAKSIFSDCMVRHVIKATQHYGDLLDYSTHPSCMIDYIEREKLFENLWMHEYANSNPVPYEMRDMLQHDIPIFFNPVATTDLVASQGETIKDMYQTKAIDLEVARIKNYSKAEEAEQLDYLKTSFGLYHASDLQQKRVTLTTTAYQDDFLAGAIAIGETISNAAFVGTDSITWKNIEETSPDNYVVNVMNENLYDGLTGMYLYFSEMYHTTGEPRFREPYKLAEAFVLELQGEYVDSTSAFFGSFSAVYPLLYTYCYTGEAILLDEAVRIAEQYIERYDKATIENYDWNGGTASIVKVFTHLYQLTQNQRYLLFAHQLLLDLDLTKITQGGFAHGYSGVIHSANSVLKFEKDHRIEQLIDACLIAERATFDSEQKGWLDFRMTPPMTIDLWCYGSTGIGLAYLDLFTSGFEDPQLAEEIICAADRLIKQDKRDDCLCHGNFGDLEFLLSFAQSELASEEQKEQIQQKLSQVKQKIDDEYYTFEGLPTIPKYGLFTGLAGIGHQLLRISASDRVGNVLMLDLPQR